MSKKLLALLIVSSLLANRTAHALEFKSEVLVEPTELAEGITS